MRKKGFTMIELLVVIAILGFMVTLGLSTFTKSLSRGRDAKRVSDLKEIQKGFELYYSTHDSNYAACDVVFADPDVFPRQKPAEPTGSFVYLEECSDSAYTFCSGLENGEDYGNATCSNWESVSSCDFTSTDANSYCVVNVQ